MRAPIYFYVSQYHRETRPFAVPVHLVNDIGRGVVDTGGGWVTVRALAGRRAGGTFTIVRNELHHSPGGARLVAGSREAIARYGLRVLEEEAAARALRKRIGPRRLSERQLRNAFARTIQLADRVRQKTPSDRAWVYFDRDLEEWRAGSRTERYGTPERLLVLMLDMVLGAASRYVPPQADVHSMEYQRAEMLDRNANALFTRTLGLGFENPAPWLEVADAFEVSEDAWREAGDDDRADRLAKRRHDILDVLGNPEDQQRWIDPSASRRL